MVLLDTCALIWLANGDPMSRESITAIDDAALDGNVLVSPVSAWEIGLMATSKRASVSFLPSPQQWLATFLSRPGVRLTGLTAEAALDSSFLPGELHADPGDRLLISSARQADATLITRDQRILDYARARGEFIKVVRC